MKTALLCLAVLGSSLSAALAGGVQNSSYPPAATQIDDLAAVLEQQRQAAERAVYQVAQANAAAPAWHPEQLPALQQLNGQGCAGVNPEFWPLTADPIAAGVRLKNVVHFAFDRADLSRESQKVLDQLIAVFAQHPQMQVTLLGYTDKRATQKYNLELAQRRIQSVQDYLAAQGIAVQRIQSEAKGAADLQADANLRLASAKSRRVVLQLSSSEQIQVILEPQWQDLQIESDQQKAKVN